MVKNVFSLKWFMCVFNSYINYLDLENIYRIKKTSVSFCFSKITLNSKILCPISLCAKRIRFLPLLVFHNFYSNLKRNHKKKEKGQLLYRIFFSSKS